MEQIAEVYARALHEVAEAEGHLSLVRDQLGSFADALADNRELQTFFFSPYFSSAEKSDGLKKMVTGADPSLLRFLDLLIEKHRMPAIFRIRRELDRLVERDEGLLPVQITSATELDPATADSLGKRIGEQTGRTVTLSTNVDPDIVGGLILRVGNQILDASIRTRLERLRQQVATGA